MKLAIRYLVFVLLGVLTSCKQEHSCGDSQLSINFVGYSPTEIDTFVLKKFAMNDGFRKSIDSSFIIIGTNASLLKISNDTSTVFVSEVNGLSGVKAGFDWKIYIPSNNKEIVISDITSEHRTIKCGGGMDKQGCNCANKVFSYIQDTMLINSSNEINPRIFITK